MRRNARPGFRRGRPRALRRPTHPGGAIPNIEPTSPGLHRTPGARWQDTVRPGGLEGRRRVGKPTPSPTVADGAVTAEATRVHRRRPSTGSAPSPTTARVTAIGGPSPCSRPVRSRGSLAGVPGSGCSPNHRSGAPCGSPTGGGREHGPRFRPGARPFGVGERWPSTDLQPSSPFQERLPGPTGGEHQGVFPWTQVREAEGDDQGKAGSR